jgi:hypothetical protein
MNDELGRIWKDAVVGRSLTKPETQELCRTIIEVGLVFRVVMPCELVDIYDFNPKNGGSMFLRNTGTYLQVHTALQPRRPTSTPSPP